MNRRVCVATGSRAEYGLLRSVMEAVVSHPKAELSTLVTGSHLSADHGNTIDEIIKDGFPISYRIPILDSSDGASAVSGALGRLFAGIGEAFDKLRPDILVVLGDRYESFALTSAALIHGIPVAHLHGGELSYGAIDDAFRHSMSKMSWWHFTATEEYRQRVISLGEDPARVFNVGALACDSVDRTQNISREELEHSLGMKLSAPLIMGTFHPETSYPGESLNALDEILTAVSEAKPASVVWTMANADAEGRVLNEKVKKFIAANPQLNMRLFDSLGQVRYLALMKLAQVVVGNSSSGLLEAPIVGTPTVNVGRRQDGRLKTASVLDCSASKPEVLKALQHALTAQFQQSAKSLKHPFGEPGVGKRIVSQLLEAPLPRSLAKFFHTK